MVKNEEHKRFKIVLDKLNVNQRQVASILHCNESFVSRMVHGTVTITYKTLHKIKSKIPEFDIDFVKIGKRAEILIPESAQSFAISNNIIKEPSGEYLLKKEIEYKDKLLALKEERIKQLEQELHTEKRSQRGNLGEVQNNAHTVLLNSYSSKKKRNPGK